MIRDIRMSDGEIEKTPNKMAITSRIRQGLTIRSMKVNIKLHRSLNSALITKSRTSKKILDILFFGNKKPLEVEETSIPRK